MIIAGTGGHAKEVALVLSRQGESDLIFLDETLEEKRSLFLRKWDVITNYEELKRHVTKDKRFVLGTGTPRVRYYFCKKLEKLGLVPFSPIDPTVIVGNSAQLGVIKKQEMAI